MPHLLTAEDVMLAEDYLDAELRATEKHEFHKGKQTTMAGGDYFHNKIKFEIAMWLERFFRENGLDFEVLNSDMKTWLADDNRFVYPDVTVLSLPPAFFISETGQIRRDAITNPVLIVEVLSDETRQYDKSEKWERYCTLPSFREYLLVEPGFAWAKSIYLENPEEGIQRVQTATALEDSLVLHSLGCTLPLKDIYQVVQKLGDWPVVG